MLSRINRHIEIELDPVDTFQKTPVPSQLLDNALDPIEAVAKLSQRLQALGGISPRRIIIANFISCLTIKEIDLQIRFLKTPQFFRLLLAPFSRLPFRFVITSSQKATRRKQHSSDHNVTARRLHPFQALMQRHLWFRNIRRR